MIVFLSGRRTVLKRSQDGNSEMGRYVALEASHCSPFLSVKIARKGVFWIAPRSPANNDKWLRMKWTRNLRDEGNLSL